MSMNNSLADPPYKKQFWSTGPHTNNGKEVKISQLLQSNLVMWGLTYVKRGKKKETKSAAAEGTNGTSIPGDN
jgi:hypothetical protein